MIPDHLRIQPGQKELTPEQEREAERFAQAWIAAQLSTELVVEPEAERFLQQAYQVAGFAPPPHISWVDGPLSLMAALTLQGPESSREELVAARVYASVEDSVWDRVAERVNASVGEDMWDSVWRSVGERVRQSVWYRLGDHVEARVRESEWDRLAEKGRLWLWPHVRAYDAAPWLANFCFFGAYLAPNDLHALAHFNKLVSGYWLGLEEAILVRRPHLLARDGQDQLHSATSKCIEYRDGWGFYAWHGVRVSEQIILRPETLTRQDFLSEPNVEVRRVIQERMGEQFMSKVGGVMLDRSSRGMLYEVKLPDDDPEGVARYVQVENTSTERQYFLRVPPTVQTAAEAVAWTFQVAAADYRPVQET